MNQILTETVTDSNDFRAVLVEAAYDEMVALAEAAYIQFQTENVNIPWDVLYNGYVQAWTRQGYDFSGFQMPAAPEVPADDFAAWVAQHEGDYADAHQSQYTGIAMF